MMKFDYGPYQLSETDILKITKRIQNSQAPAVLSREEQELINDYRLMDRKSQMKVLRFVATILDNKFMGDDY